MKSKRAVIIGGGLVGCLTAVEMQHKGFDVTIIDQFELGSGSSVAAGGILFPLMPWDYDEKVYDLCKSAANYYKYFSAILLKETGIDPEYHESGLIMINPVDNQKIFNWCDQHDVDLKKITFNGSPSIELSNVSQIRPTQLMRSLKVYMQHLNIKVHVNSEIIDFNAEREEVTECLSSDGKKFIGDKFIITSGAWAANLLKEYKEKIYPIRGQMIQFPKSNLELKKIMYHDGFYMIPRMDGTIVAGSTLEDVGFSIKETEGSIDDLKNKAEHIYPELIDVKIEKSWHGFRPGTHNNIPIIGKYKDYKNLYLNVGHHRYGVTMAPKSAEIITSLIMS